MFSGNEALRKNSDSIVAASIRAVQPDSAARRTLESWSFNGRVRLVPSNKASWHLEKAASDLLGSYIEKGLLMTK